MKIDIERLHKRPKYGRRSGRTFDMVVELLQNIAILDEGENVVYGVKIANPQFSRYIRKLIWQIAPHFDLRVYNEKSDSIKVEGKSCEIVIFTHHTMLDRHVRCWNGLDPLDYTEYVEFRDHYEHPISLVRNQYKNTKT